MANGKLELVTNVEDMTPEMLDELHNGRGSEEWDEHE